MPRKASKPKSKVFKSNQVAPNNDLPMVDRYKQSYELLFSRLSDDLKKRVLQLKEDSLKGIPSRDYEVHKFINDVIAMAEAEPTKEEAI
jgi:hypothetical protein